MFQSLLCLKYLILLELPSIHNRNQPDPSETHLKLKPRSLITYLSVIWSFLNLIKSSYHVVLCAKFQNDWIIETAVTYERDFARFQFRMSFGRISYIAQHPWLKTYAVCSNNIVLYFLLWSYHKFREESHGQVKGSWRMWVKIHMQLQHSSAHWPVREVVVILKCNIRTQVIDWVHEQSLWNCSDENATNHVENKSILVQVIAWCRQATSHYLSQCWPRSMSPEWPHSDLDMSKVTK